MDLAQCGEIGSLQDGLITRHQALDVLAEDQIDRTLAAGTWERMHASVYRIRGAVDTWRSRVKAATLIRSGDRPVASHLTAARLWGLIDWEPEDIEVLVPYTSSARVPGVTVHRTRTYLRRSLTVHDDIAVTTAARTIIDMSSKCGRGMLKAAIDNAIVKRLVTIEAIYEEMKEIGTKGRGRCRMLREILSHYGEGIEKVESHTQMNVLEWLTEAGVDPPAAEYSIPGTGLRADFAYPDLKIAIECQSWRWHGGPSKFEDDIRRKNTLRKLGWTVIEFSYKSTRSEVLGVISAAFRAAA